MGMDPPHDIEELTVFVSIDEARLVALSPPIHPFKLLSGIKLLAVVRVFVVNLHAAEFLLSQRNAIILCCPIVREGKYALSGRDGTFWIL